MSALQEITKDNFAQAEKAVQRLESLKRKKQLAANLCTPLGNIFLMLCLALGTYGAMLLLGEPAEQTAILKIDFLAKVWQWYVSVLPADLPAVVQILVAVAATVLVPFALNLIITILVSVLGPSGKAQATSGSMQKRADALLDRCQKANYKVSLPDFNAAKLTTALYAVGCIVFFVYFVLEAGKTDPAYKDTINETMFLGMVATAGLLVLLMVILRKLLGALNKLLFSFSKENQLPGQIKQFRNECEKEEKERKEHFRKLQEQEEKKREKEAKKRREEQERKRKEEAKEIYAQAIAGETPDADLIQKAADMGDPNACLFVGKEILDEWASGLYTDEEKEELAKKAAGYLKNATDTTEGKFLWIFSRINYESNKKPGWESILRQLREIRKSGDLPEQYEESCELAIKQVVRAVDDLAAKEDYTPPAKQEPRIKRTYCKFANGAICTYYSDSISVAKCNYLSNPGSCAAALNNKGLGFEFY